MQETLFSFKQKSQDFIVQEELPFALSGRGDVFFVLFEKRNLNTMDVVHHLCTVFGISRLTLGIAGLKDKRAIARQRICIYKSALKRIWWERVFLDSLGEVVKVMDTNRHTEPIGMTIPIQNTFSIRLRGTKHLSLREKQLSHDKIVSLFAKWFPNFFGVQRFGINGSNPKQWYEILQGISKIVDKKEILFKIQAYASKMFNDYMSMRTKHWLVALDGDIIQVVDPQDYKKTRRWVYQAGTDTVRLIDDSHRDTAFFRHPKVSDQEIPFDISTMHITGPVLGYNLLLADKDSAAWKKEQSFLTNNAVTPSSLDLCRSYKIFGIRRPMWAFPQKVSVHIDRDDLLLHFTLASGSYASIMIHELEKTLWLHISAQVE